MANGLFYTLAALATLVFAVGMASHLRVWLGAQGSSSEGEESRATFVLREISRALARRRTWRALLWEGVLQRQIWRESRLRWLIHISLSWGFTELFFATSVDLLIRRGVLPLTKDTPWFAILNEIGGLLLLMGVGLALYRRLVMRPAHLHTEAQDLLILLWLLVLGLGGYLAEAARFGVEATPASVARWSFVGYGLFHGLQVAGIDPASLMSLAWWSHALASLALIAALPYTKLLHIFTAPLVLTLETAKTTPETVARVPAGWVPSPHLQQIARAAGWDPDQAARGFGQAPHSGALAEGGES